MCDNRFHLNETDEKVGFQEQYEGCVCCGCSTDVLRRTSIHLRKYYVEGAGELCEACFGKIYGGNT